MRLKPYLILALGLGLCLLSLGRAVIAEQPSRHLIDPAMMVHLRNLETTIRSVNPGTLAEHRKVSDSLDEEMGKLLASCTMKGEAHDALHDWLVPFIQKVQNYGEQEKLTELSGSLGVLREAFIVFNSRFQ